MNVFRRAGQKKNIIRPANRHVPIADGTGLRRTTIRRPLLGQKSDRFSGQFQKNEKMMVCIQRRLGGIGDVLMTTPVLRAIKTRFPKCHLTYATDPEYYHGELIRILEHNPYIDEVVNYRNIDRSKFQFFTDLTGIEPPFERKDLPVVNRIDMYARHVGISLDNPLPIYIVTDKEKQWAREIFTQWFEDPAKYTVVCLHTASVDLRRTWPIENYVRLVSEVAQEREDIRFLILDHNRKLPEWNYKHCVDISSYGIRQTAALIDRCNIFVGPDSGPLHIAGALEKEIVSVFGSSNPMARINYYDNAVSVTADTPCKFCLHPESLVIGQDFVKTISSFDLGDRVFDAAGLPRRIEQKNIHSIEDRMYEIRMAGTNVPIKITGQHRVFAVERGHCRKTHRKEYVMPELVLEKPICELQRDDYLLLSPPVLGGPEIFKTEFCQHHSANKIPEEIRWDYNFAWFIGMFLAEASCQSSSISFCTGPEEDEIRERLLKIGQEYFGLAGKISPQKNNRAIDVYFCSASLSRRLSSLFGKRASEKRIPLSILPYNIEVIKGLIDGLFAGDGYINNRSVVLGTASQHLAYQVYELLILLGSSPRIYRRIKNTNYKTGAIYWRVEHEISNIVNRMNMTEAILNKKFGFSPYIHMSCGTLVPIREIKEIDYDGPVVDLGISESHTYNVNGFAIFNCWYASCRSDLSCMKNIKVEKVKQALLDKIDNRIPEIISDKRIRICVRYPSSVDLEISNIAKDLVAGFSALGVVAVENPTDSRKEDISIDVFRSSLVENTNDHRSPDSKLNLCFPIITETRITRDAANRIASGYDVVLTTGLANSEAMREGGIRGYRHTIHMPMVSAKKAPRTKENVVGSVITNFIPENVSLLISSIKDCGLNLDLILCCLDGEQEVRKMAKEMNITILSPGELDIFWDRIGLYIDAQGASSGYFAGKAISKLLPTIIGDYGTVKWLDDRVCHKIPVSETKPYMVYTSGKYVGTYSTHDKQIIIDSLMTVVKLGCYTIEDLVKARDYLLKESSVKTFKRLINILQKKVGT